MALMSLPRRKLVQLSCCNRLTDSMQLSHHCEAARHSATQEFPNVLRNSELFYRVHKSPTQIPILSQMKPVHTTLSYFPKIHLNISRPHTSRFSWLSLSFWLSHQNPICILPHKACYIPYLSHSH
jgi:hypothetical protein